MKRSFVAALMLSLVSSAAWADWKSDPVWHDGLVEKATYSASRVIYGKPRQYEAIFFTNKEQHDTKTWTKSDKSQQTAEVFKHNQIEVIPTPNYDYKYTTTSHLTVDKLQLTRLDMGSQEFCGTSFKQYLLAGDLAGSNLYDYFGFSYFPEAGRLEKKIDASSQPTPVVAFNSLPVYLRSYDFNSKQTQQIQLLPDQKLHKPTPADPVKAEVRYAGEEGNAHKLELHVDGKLHGTYWFAKDRLNVMTKYQSADGEQTYELKNQERVNYWTIKE